MSESQPNEETSTVVVGEGQGLVPTPEFDESVESHGDSLAAPEVVTEDALDVETLVGSLEAVTLERDTYLADLQRVSAEFANFRRQASKRQHDTVQHAANGLVEKLLPVLDACDAAVIQGAADVDPIRAALVDTLVKEGLELLTEAGEVFDPERHEAVLHEQADGATEPTVAEIMRSGYVWNGRVLRPAMVKVQG